MCFKPLAVSTALSLILSACSAPRAGQIAGSTLENTAAPTLTATLTDTATPLPTPTASVTPTATVPPGESAKLVEVVDGDTIVVEVNGQVAEVRYIGIDTPERDEPCSDDARAVNEGLLAGETITLVKDTSNADRYGRLLRYVYAGNSFVNAVMVAEGWAVTSIYPPDTLHTEEFLRLEQDARQQNTGCWPVIAVTLENAPPAGESPCDCTGPDVNCGHFDTHAEAQSCFEACVVARGFDVFHLDGDGNTLACERLP